MEDIELLREYAEHRSQQAFTELVDRRMNLVYATALRKVGDADLAKDVAQMVFLDLARKAKQLRRETVLTGWLYRSTHYAAANVLRAEGRRHKRETTAMQLMELNSDGQSVWREVAPLLDEAMRRLSRTDQDALLLRYFEGKSCREVGQALGMKDDTLQKRVARALEKLRSFFARKGVKVPAAALVSALAANAVQAAPAGLAASCATQALFVVDGMDRRGFQGTRQAGRLQAAGTRHRAPLPEGLIIGRERVPARRDDAARVHHFPADRHGDASRLYVGRRETLPSQPILPTSCRRPRH